ncbi:MAG: hypothetical protein JW910_12705, partial [Anaerolineae bacterium]|nr:hypothetical protein [Anaerolineae bacterium]
MNTGRGLTAVTGLTLLLVALILAMPVATVSMQGDPASGVLTADAGAVVGEISPYVYGANFGPLSVVSVDLFEAAQNSGITFLRFPGGRWGDLNDMRPFHIDMYMSVVELMGVEPSIHVRLENGTPEAAAELVRYCNIENDYNVRFWYIGNEPTLFDDYTTDDLNREWRAIAEAMLAVDPDIILIGPEPHQWNGTTVTPDDAAGRDFTEEFLRANGDLVDVVAVHRYPFPASAANPVTSIEDLRENAPEWSEILPRLRALIEETTGRTDLPVAVTEANSHWSGNANGEATPDSHY